MPLSEHDLFALRESLLQRQEILRDVARTHRDAEAIVELDQARMGRLSRMDALQSQAMAAELRRRNDRELAGIKGALERIDQGEYGPCIECDELIALPRLQANPIARVCIECAGRRERR